MVRPLLATVLFVAAAAVAADPPPKLPAVVGEPKGVEPKGTTGYWVWYADGAWHVRTASKSGQHRYNATVTVTGGTVAKATMFKPESETKKSGDRVEVTPDKKAVTIEFKTGGNMDGADIVLDPRAKEVRFALFLDAEGKPDAVHLGPTAAHPPASTFTYPARPKK